MTKHRYFAAGLSLVALAGCSSRPRDFTPTLQAAPADGAKYAADYESCRKMVAEGQRSGFGARLASGGAGVVAGVGVTAATVGGTAGTMAGAAAAASVAMVMLPVVGVAAAWGVAKARKANKEREVKDATALCLSEAGYMVSDWTVAKRRRPVGTASVAAATTR